MVSARVVVTSLAALALAASYGATRVLADSNGSDAAQICLQGPQIDYYQLVGETDSSPPLDFHGLAHGSDETGTYIVAQSYGDCVSFAAYNSKGTNSNKPKETITLNFTKVIYVNTTQ